MANRANPRPDLGPGSMNHAPVIDLEEPGPSWQFRGPTDVSDRFTGLPSSPIYRLLVNSAIPTSAGTVSAGTVSAGTGSADTVSAGTVSAGTGSADTVSNVSGTRSTPAGAVPPPDETFRTEFYRKFEEQNQTVFTKEKYDSMIGVIQYMRNNKLSLPQNTLLYRYDVAIVNGVCRLVDDETLRSPDTGQQLKVYAYSEEVFDVLSRNHGLAARPHNGRSVTFYGVNMGYRNINADVVRLYVDLCPQCRDVERWAANEMLLGMVPAVPLVPPPVPETAKRYQVDVLGTQVLVDGGRVGQVLLGRDVRTGFVSLRPLTNGAAAEEVAQVLIDDVFAVFEAPMVLQSSQGRAFARNVVKQLSAMWPPARRMVYGDATRWPPPRHRSGFSDTQDIADALCTWRARYNNQLPTFWSASLKHVQHAFNHIPVLLPDGRWCTPQELMFKDPLPAWKTVPEIPPELSASIKTEDVLESVLKLFTNPWQIEDGYGDEVSEQLTKDGESMPKVGDNVMVKLICLHTHKLFNVLGAVVSIRGDDAFELATSAGRVQQLCRRNQFMIINWEPPIRISQLPLTKVISCKMPRYYECQDNAGCQCLQKCKSRKCICLKFGKKCATYCHNFSPCFNSD